MDEHVQFYFIVRTSADVGLTGKPFQSVQRVCNSDREAGKETLRPTCSRWSGDERRQVRNVVLVRVGLLVRTRSGAEVEGPALGTSCLLGKGGETLLEAVVLLLPLLGGAVAADASDGVEEVVACAR